jgi:hypothetical protein
MTAVALALKPVRIPAELEQEILVRIDHAGLHVCEAELRYKMRWDDRRQDRCSSCWKSSSAKDSSRPRCTSGSPTTAASCSPMTTGRRCATGPGSRGRCAHEDE